MYAQIKEWGNSQGIRLSKEILKWLRGRGDDAHLLEEIADVQLFYDNEDGSQLFSADSLGFTYNTMFIEYKYNSNMLQEGTKDRGLIYTFVFRDKIEE